MVALNPKPVVKYFAEVINFAYQVSNSNCSMDHMRAYKVKCEPQYNADATKAVPELLETAFKHLISCERYHEFCENHYWSSLCLFKRNL